jgi:hypothetical protein
MTKQTHKGYSIEQERNGTFSAYSLSNSMYDCHSGFPTVEAAIQFINERVA